MAGIAESLIGQIQQAGQPRVSKSTTTTTTKGKEDPNLGMLGMILAMLLEGQEPTIPPIMPPESLEPVGGLAPGETVAPPSMTPSPLSTPGAPPSPIGLTPPGPSKALPPLGDILGASSTTTPVEGGKLPESALNMEDILSQVLGGPGALDTSPQAPGLITSEMTLQQLLNLIAPQKPFIPPFLGSSVRR